MELIKIYNGTLVNGRELHQFLVEDVKKGKKGEKFSDWIKRMLEFNFKISEDFFTVGYDYKGDIIEENGVPKFRKPDNQRVNKREYYLTLNCAKQIAMIQNNEKGREARQYFIKCEETLQQLKHDKRFEAFMKLEATKARLLAIVENLGGSHDDYIQIDVNARKVFYNGKELPDNNAPTLILKGRDFATELTTYNATDMESLGDLNNSNHKDVRDMIEEKTGKKPEELPREEKIKRLGE